MLPTREMDDALLSSLLTKCIKSNIILLNIIQTGYPRYQIPIFVFLLNFLFVSYKFSL